MLDGAMFVSPDEGFKDGLSLTDARLGFKASYRNFDAKVEIGYANEKVALKDAFISAKLSSEFSLKAGNFHAPFGQLLVYSSNKTLMNRPLVCDAFLPGRGLGVMATWNKVLWQWVASAQVESKSTVLNATATNGQGWSIFSRFIIRPYRQTGSILQLGISGGYLSPQYNDNAELNHHSFSASVYFPSRVSRVVAAKYTLPGARGEARFTPEFVAAWNGFALQGQYYFNHAWRNNGLEGYNTYGLYLIGSALIGGDYSYGSSDGRLALPKEGSKEMALAYSYTNLNSAGISGGRVADFQVNFNWYINKYIIWRVAASYTYAFNLNPTIAADGADHMRATALQTRLQFMF